MKPTGSNSFKGWRSRSDRSVKLNEGLDKRLASYTAAASAAGVGRRARAPGAVAVITRAASAVGVGLLLSAGPASARIVYTPAYTALSVYGPLLDLNHDGITDFKFLEASGDSHFRLSVFAAQAGNAILGKVQGVLSDYGRPFTCPVASALPAGHRIGPGSNFGAYPRMLFRQNYMLPISMTPYLVYGCGYWNNGRFLGFEFTIHGQNHFGWARLNYRYYDGATCRVYSECWELTGYAYETEPNKPIRAGDTGPVADARAPEMYSAPRSAATLRPATLGVLALGSAGLDIWRKEE
jgi:hypothetical protein